MLTETAKKLSAASAALIIDKPFLGALVLRLPMKAVQAGWCKTIGTDARAIYYNPEYINSLSFKQTLFIVAHEALHCALSHFARRQHRVKHRWGLACDLAINPILIKEGLTPTPDALYLDMFEGLSAEEIYPMLDDLEHLNAEDDHLYDNEQQQLEPQGQGSPQQAQTDPQSGAPERPKPLSSEEREHLSLAWQQRLAGAAQQAKQAGKLSGSMARLVDHLLQPRLPWRMLLAKYMTQCARDDYNYTRPSKREGQAILPSLRSQQANMVVVIDTSGSVSKGEMADFFAEVNAIKGQVRARILLHACDQVLDANGPWTYEVWENFSLPGKLQGGGGTSFCPVFDWLDTENQQPDLLVYFTDALGQFPRDEPTYPVLWLVKGRATVPWGQRIQLN